MRFLGSEATRERLPFAALVAALRTMFEEGCELPACQLLALDPAARDGVKVVNVAPGNAARGNIAHRSAPMIG